MSGETCPWWGEPGLIDSVTPFLSYNESKDSIGN